jgi:hypothetical protein
VRGVKSGEEGRQVFADAMQEGSCSHTKSHGRGEFVNEYFWARLGDC